MNAPRKQHEKKADGAEPAGVAGVAAAGTLWVVSTPIGNLDDITLRALEVLRRVAVIACEDTRRTMKLLAHFKIGGKRLVSYYRGQERQRGTELLQILAGGRDVALVSDAGTPGISDPGGELLRQARQRGITVTVGPGVSAPIVALTASGLASDNFLFLGYLPSDTKERRAFLSPLRWEQRTLIFFEAPHRLDKSLADLAGAFGARRMAVARELTKINEEVLHGTAGELADRLKGADKVGEVTIIVAGFQGAPPTNWGRWNGYSLAAHLKQVMIDDGLSLSRAVEKVGRLRSVPSETLYRIAREAGLEGRDDA